MPSTQPDNHDDYVPLREFLEAKLDGIRTELKWHRWGMIALAGVTGLSKLAGTPSVPDAAAAVVRHFA